MAEWCNWADTVEYENLARLYTPRTVEELRADVADATKRGWRLRAVGSGHAWSNLGLPSRRRGAVISLAHLNHAAEVIEPPGSNGEGVVRVDGGVTIEYLCRWLDSQGLALFNMGDANPQTIAGAIATETHGSGIHLGSISEYVEGISIVKADASIAELAGDQLRAGRVALGKLGVVFSVKLKVRKKYFLKHVQVLIPFNEKSEAANIEQYKTESQPDSAPIGNVGKLRHFEYWYYPYTGNAERILRYEVDSTVVSNPLKITDEWFIRASSGILETIGKHSPERIPQTVRNAQLNNKGLFEATRQGPWHELLLGKANVWRKRVRTYTMEYQFSYDNLWRAFNAMEASITLAARKGVFVASPIQIRFTKASARSLMTNLRHEPTVSFSISFFREHEGAHTWLPELERRLIERPILGRPHWGKMYYVEPQPTTESALFESIRQTLDPNGTFAFRQNLYTPDPEAFQEP